jgi:hypothetical protein
MHERHPGAELYYMRKMMYENKTELDRIKNMVQALKEGNKRLIRENESLSKSTPTRFAFNDQHNTPGKPDLLTNGRTALIRGSPVDKETYDEDPSGYRDTGVYEIDGSRTWGVPKNKDMKLQLAKFAAKETYNGLWNERNLSRSTGNRIGMAVK